MRNREQAIGLLEMGFGSAIQIARMPREAFIDDCSGLLGEVGAERVHRRATRVGEQVTHTWATLSANVAAPSAQALKVNTVASTLPDAFQKLPSYQELFGSLNYYGCEECGSILGPAAYLVELLRIIDRYVTSPNTKTIPKELTFEERRPDIPKIPLTCEEATTRLPYLRIVNERLAETARQQLKLGDEAALWKYLASAPYPMELPVNVPLEEVRILLASVGVTLSALYAAWQKPALKAAGAALDLSPAQVSLLTTPVAGEEAKLAARYGIEASQSAFESLSAPETFCERTGLDVAQLTTLVDQDLTEAELKKGIAKTFFVNRGLAAENLQLEIVDKGETSKIEHLTHDALDRANRFIRLAEELGWSFVELDWALHAVAGGQPVLEAAHAEETIGGLAAMRALGEELELGVLDTGSLLTQLKTYGSAGAPSQFDQLFNAPGQLSGDPPYHPKGDPYNPTYESPLREWTVAGKDEADQAIAGWLSGALGISTEAVRELAGGLFEKKSKVALDVPALSALRRHALLANRLQLPVDQYLILLAAEGLDGAETLEPAQLASLVDSARWLTASRLDAYSLQYVLAGTASAYAQPLYRPAEIPAWLESLWKLSANLTGRPFEEQLFAQLAILYGLEGHRIEAAMPLAALSVKLPDPLKSWQEAFVGPAAGEKFASMPTVEELLSWGSRWLVLAQSLELPNDLLEGVTAHPSAYGLDASPKALAPANVRDLEAFHRFMLAFQDAEGELIAYAASVAKGETVEAQAKALAAASGWEEAQVKSLLEALAKGDGNAVTALDTLSACFELAGRLGADTTYAAALAGLAELEETNWPAYEATAAGVRNQIASPYERATWEANEARLEGETDALKRDALLPLVRWKLSGTYADVVSDREVYEFVLIEVETGPAVEISRIVEATNAAQLYLQRCRLRLEKGVKTLDIPETWWQWIMNFRTWQANREVFLYPENYLLPSVRRNKTALFKELEGELQQSQVTEGSVEEAYEGYFAAFREIAKLKPVDCYHCEVNGPEGPVDTLFLFARSETEPPVFYYCTRRRGLTWTEWVKIDLSINSETITPVYAFNRLFVFWAELKKATNTTVTSTGTEAKSAESVAWAQTIKYSFLDHRGKWVPPQTLVEERVVNYEPPEGKPKPAVEPFAPLLDMSDPKWRRVFVTKTGGGNLVADGTPPVEFERISVFCGPFLLEEGGKTYEPTPDPKGENETETEFLEAMYERTVALDSLIEAKLKGQLPVTAPVNLDINLQNNFVLSKDEFLILSVTGNASTNPTVTAQIDSLDGYLTIVPSSEVLYDEYSGDASGSPVKLARVRAVTAASLEENHLEPSVAAAIPPRLEAAGLLDTHGRVVRPFTSSTDIATHLSSLGLSAVQLEAVRQTMFASLGTMVPLRDVSPVNGRTITVKNQPGWFQFDNGDESFLLTLPPQTQASAPVSEQTDVAVFEETEEGLRAQRPTLSAASFEIAGIDSKTAKAAYEELEQVGFIDEAGNVAYEEVEQVVNEGKLSKYLYNAGLSKDEDQVTAIGNVMLNTPFASAGSFVSPGIAKPAAEKIAEEFVRIGLIDVNGRVTLTELSEKVVELALGNLVLDKYITPQQIPGIYEILLGLTSPVEYAYRNQGPPKLESPWDYTFDVTRTSTGAVDRLSKTLFAQGIPGLLSLSSQQAPVVGVLPFERFSPDPYTLNWPKALDGAQVDFEGVYGLYYWEVFYFVPMLVANSLSTNQQFETAEAWFRYVLDPTAPEEPVLETTFFEESEKRIGEEESKKIFGELKTHQIPSLGAPALDEHGRVNPKFDAKTELGFLLGKRASNETLSIVRTVLLNHRVAAPADHYWRFWPFRNATLETLEETLSDRNPAIEIYESDPFDPFAIAGLRIGAFEKATLMQYVQNLISWGDSLFSQESFETTTAATMLYVYAYDLLGERPVELLAPTSPPPMTFAEIKAKNPDGIPVFLIEVENALPAPSGSVPEVGQGGTPFNALDSYFCVPENEQLLRYWDTLDDRLFKIRNSMNIEGEVRELPLFAPPLNPLELVKAAAAGGGFLPATAKAAGSIPAYRFEPMLARARSATAQVMDLGSKLLMALERRDAESLELLRSTQERQVLTMMTTAKEDALAEGEASLAGLRESLAGAKNRVSHFQKLLSEGLNAKEDTNLESLAAGLAFNILASGLRAAAAIAYTIPQVGSPFAMTYGGIQVGSSFTAASAGAEIGAEISNYVAQRSITMAGYDRREEDWTLALQDAQYEVASLEQQIRAAQAHLKSAQQDLAVTKAEIAQNERVYEYLKGKFTSADLYQWLVGRISTVYFQAYRLALELSQAAQECFQFELGVEESFLSFEYWDNLHKGLMAGENLNFSLAQMESAYTAKNTRRLEIERTVSLALWDPLALWTLRTTGRCEFELSEQLFDYDYPGQYNRQIRAVTVSIPAVLGPYEEFKATLKQTYSAVAMTAEEAAVKYLLTPAKNPKPASLRENWAPRQQIAISRGSEDAGVFELNSHDERYLPFEGTGAVSKWELQVPPETNRFNLNAIGDVIVTVRYTALEGSAQFGKAMRGLLGKDPFPGAVYLSLAQAYAIQWNAFMAERSSTEKQVLDFEIPAAPMAGFRQATLKGVYVRLETDGVPIANGSAFLSVSIDARKEEDFSFSEEVGKVEPLTLAEDKFLGPWKLVFDLEKMRKSQQLAHLLDGEGKWLDPAKLLNAELILDYEGSVF
ncbi:MAG: neuraminidase-like domain-containing protein [Solirubrobacterales bacterium]